MLVDSPARETRCFRGEGHVFRASDDVAVGDLLECPTCGARSLVIDVTPHYLRAVDYPDTEFIVLCADCSDTIPEGTGDRCEACWRDLVRYGCPYDRPRGSKPTTDREVTYAR